MINYPNLRRVGSYDDYLWDRQQEERRRKCFGCCRYPRTYMKKNIRCETLIIHELSTAWVTSTLLLLILLFKMLLFDHIESYALLKELNKSMFVWIMINISLYAFNSVLGIYRFVFKNLYSFYEEDYQRYAEYMTYCHWAFTFVYSIVFFVVMLMSDSVGRMIQNKK